MDPASSLDALRRFFEEAPAGRKATGPLSRDARVGLALDEGPARFGMDEGRPTVRPGEEPDPDFTLTLPAAAVARLTQGAPADVGEMGIRFFELVLSRDPALKARIRIHASTARLVAHGYLGVLALGGFRVALWLLRKGVRDPKGAIDRLRGR